MVFKRNTQMRLVISFFSLLLSSSVISPTAKAVTNGSLVVDPKSAAPYVVSIWTSEKSNDYKDAEFICTGTLIGPQVVLTAAHCVTLTTPYFVKVGAEALNDSTNFTAVSGVWTNPRYSSRTYANDIGLLKLEERFENITFPTLASSITAKSINKFSKFRIFGWGLDQEENLADLLRTSELSLQDSVAAKSFGKTFNPVTMLAAGRKIRSENVWSGACNGDSGGPLLSNINGLNIIVGVTSWGARNCSPNKPSIFSRVSYYEKDIRRGIREVEAQSVVVNRTAPIATTEPDLIGQARPGSVLKCSPGVWKNAVSIQTAWTSPARLVGSLKSEITVLPGDGGAEFRCEVLVSSSGASVRRVLRTSITGTASLTSNPIISGLASGASFRTGMTARCEGWNWRTPVDSEKITWFTSSSSSPSTPVNGRQIGSGSSLTFDSSMLKDENGRYLVCQVTGIKDGFESNFVSTRLITTPSLPSLSSVAVSAYSLSVGNSASCSYNSFGDIETSKVEWGYTSNTGFFAPFYNATGTKLIITSDLARQAAGKQLACKVTLINSGGEVTRTASSFNSFEDLPAVPSVSVSLSGGLVAGSRAFCSARSSSSYNSNTTYQWGKTSNNASNSIEGTALSTSESYAITTNTLSDLAGAFLTCVATVTNGVGSSSSAASIFIPIKSVEVPFPNAPTLESQTASSTSIAARIRIPAISAFNAATMKAVLNVNNSNCRNVSIAPSQVYECAGLSANTTYLADITISPISGIGTSRSSENLRFTTIGLSSALYVCGQSCSGSLSNTAMQYYISDKRLIEASSAPGAPITSSTCTGSGCNPGTAPVLPIACPVGSNERTNLTANATAQITTHFRHCSAPTDVSAPVIYEAPNTGYAKITPTSGPAGTSIAVRFGARDNLGITSTTVRLVNPQNVVVTTATGSFIGGGASDGIYLANVSTASSGPGIGDVYQIQAQARDAAGNASTWYTVGGFIITSSNVDCRLDSNSLNSICTNITGIDIRVTTNNSSLLKVEFCAISPSEYVWFKAGSTFYNLRFPITGGGYSVRSVSLPTTYVRNCASGGSWGSAELASPAAGATYTIQIDYVNNGVQLSKSTSVSTASDSTGPVINNLSVSPSSISTGQSINVTMQATDPSGIRGCGATVYNINGIDVVTNNVSELNPSTGVYTVNIILNSSNNPGTYTVRGFCNDNNLNRTTTSGTVSFTIGGASVSNLGSLPTPITIGINYVDQIVLNGFNFGSLGVSPGNFTWTVRTQNSSGTIVSTLPVGSNQTYITGLSGSTTYNVYLVATDSAGQSKISAPLTITTLVPAVVPTVYQFVDPGSVIIPIGRGQSWEIGIQNAVSVNVIAKSYGKPDIASNFALSCNSGANCVMAVADGDESGKKLYRAFIAPPSGTPQGVMYTLTWIAVSNTGVSTEINRGTFITGS